MEPHPLYLRGVELLRYALAPERIDQCATLAHRILEKHRKRSRQSVHRRLVTFKRTVDAPGADEFWAKLLTYLDPNIPEP
ncbi:MAG: hypothetical protein KatS3mg115_1837 [Candidatus Poribacteria bacterium]|nr:MAG: hypothetical protein KatS3mg115_1837 [Candidatus Poribacteria bacterium]